MASDMIMVEVAYAKPERQLILQLEAEQGITAKEAVIRSGILDEFPEIDIETARLGIFGKATTPETVLNPSDRVEIYRPLIADPKEARKKRAAEGKQLKNRAVRKKAVRKSAPKKAAAEQAPSTENAAGEVADKHDN